MHMNVRLSGSIQVQNKITGVANAVLRKPTFASLT